MEVYYKDLISEDASLEALVDNLTRVVQGADEFAEAATEGAREPQKAEMRTRLERLKAACRRVKSQAMAGARAADKTLHEYPYSSLGFAFSCGLLAGTLAARKR